MSTDEQEDSPVTQGQLAGDFVQAQGLPFWSRTYFDLGISGKTIKKRPGILAMMADAEALKPAAIVVYKLDRAFRNAEEQAVALNRLKRLGVKVWKIRDPNLDGPYGELVDGILGNLNQFERQLVGMRIRDHNLTMAQRGEWPGGRAPYGYQYRKGRKEKGQRKALTVETGGLEPNPDEWPTAQQIWTWALEGWRKAEILDRCNQAGYVRRNGRPWDFAGLDRMFDSQTYAGMVPYGYHANGKGGYNRSDDGEWYPGEHLAMVTLEQWHQVQASLQQGNRRQRAQRRPRAELAGLIRCRICGGSVSSSGAMADGGYSYTCITAAQRSAGHPTWSRREWIVHGAVQHVLQEAARCIPTAPLPTDGDQRRRALEQQIAGLQAQLRRIRELYKLGEYNDDLQAYQTDTAEIRVKLAAREQELRSSGPAAEEAVQRYQILQHWDAAYEVAGTIADKQRLWRLAVESVELDMDVITVRLLDLGLPGLQREWTVRLPPRKVRRPGSEHHGGIVGKPRDGRPSQARSLHPVRPLNDDV